MSPTSILVPTVGGSCSPILDSIRFHKPDFVYFVCSGGNAHREGTGSVVNGQGSPCGEGRPNIVTQTRLTEEQYRIHVVDDPDDLDECYRSLSGLFAAIAATYPRARILADYTGGTKSLSAALVVAALHQKVDLVLIRGKRHDLVRVTEGMTYPHRVPIDSVAVDSQFRLTHALERERDFAAAVRTIETTTAQQGIPRGQQDALLDHLQLARALDAWDKFDHLRAYLFFESLSKPVRSALNKAKYYDALLAVIHSRVSVDDAFKEEAKNVLNRTVKGAHGYEVVEDLLRNAERRVQQGRYDDAISRIYRAVELTGQILLRRSYGILTERIAVEQVPEPLRKQWQIEGLAGPIPIGLKQTFELLAHLDPNTFGTLWNEWGGRVRDALLVRNQSILAHGFRPVSDQGYYKVDEALGGFVRATIGRAVKEAGFDPTKSLVLQLPDQLQAFVYPTPTITLAKA